MQHLFFNSWRDMNYWILYHLKKNYIYNFIKDILCNEWMNSRILIFVFKKLWILICKEQNNGSMRNHNMLHVVGWHRIRIPTFKDGSYHYQLHFTFLASNPTLPNLVADADQLNIHNLVVPSCSSQSSSLSLIRSTKYMATVIYVHWRHCCWK